MAKIKLRIKDDKSKRVEGRDTVQWKASLPFFQNFRGLLIHRVRSARSHIVDGQLSHSSVHYLCNNFGSLCNGELLAEPPLDRLVCAVCEAFALSHGMPSSEQLTGRHCHLGKIRAERVCCRDELESN